VDKRQINTFYLQFITRHRISLIFGTLGDHDMYRYSRVLRHIPHNIYRSVPERSYRSDDPSNGVIAVALKDNG